MGRLASRRWTLGVAAAGGLAAAALLAIWMAPSLLWVVTPTRGSVVSGLQGLEVMVRFPDEERVAAETLRVLLNGADVTSQFTRGANGAYGKLHELLDGDNVLRVEVFGRRWWRPGGLVKEAREVDFLVRLPQDLDRA